METGLRFSTVKIIDWHHLLLSHCLLFLIFNKIMTSLAAIFLRSNNLMLYSPLLCISICQYTMLAILVLLLITIISFIWWLTIMCCYIASAILELRHPHWQYIQFSSVTQSCPTLWSHGSQHARPPCPSPPSRVHSDSCPSSQWCHPAFSSSVVPFSSPQSLPVSESLPQFKNINSLAFSFFYGSTLTSIHDYWKKS